MPERQAPPRLFHASEDAGLGCFEPRPPIRADLAESPALVWAVEEERLYNFLCPRDCPRVTFHARDDSDARDIARFLGSGAPKAVVAFEEAWRARIEAVTIWLYEFDPANFVLQDETAGYWVSTRAERPVGRHQVDDVLGALAARGVEVRFPPSLWQLADEVSASSLGWSLCRMRNAAPRQD